MAWPTGVTLRTCSLGPDFGIVSGDDYGCDIVVSVSRPMMTWGATGSGGIGDQDSLSFTPGLEITFQLPVTDQAGWYIGGLPVDVSDGRQSHVYALTIKPWIYNSLGRKTFSNATLTLSNLAVPTGADTLDLDKSVATAGAQGGTVTIPDLVGQLQATVETSASDAAASASAAAASAQTAHDISNIDTSDDVVSTLVADPQTGPKTTAALNAAIGGQVTPVQTALDTAKARARRLIERASMGIVRRAPLPAAFGWDPGIPVLTDGRRYWTTFDAASLRPASGTTYYVGSFGDSTGSGLLIGTLTAPLDAGVAVTSLPITAAAQAEASGVKVAAIVGTDIVPMALGAALAAGATTATVASVTPGIRVPAGSKIVAVRDRMHDKYATAATGDSFVFLDQFHLMTTALTLTKGVSLIGLKPDTKIVCTNTWTWTATTGTTNVYEASRTNVRLVVDFEADPDGFEYARVNSIAECDALAGSWYQAADGTGNYYCHRLNGGQPDNTKQIALLTYHHFQIAHGDGETVYMENLRLIGGSSGITATHSAPTPSRLVTKNVDILWGGYGPVGAVPDDMKDCLRTVGNVDCYFQNTRAAHSCKDGFNYTATTIGGVTYVARFVEINCEGYACGTVSIKQALRAAGDYTDNGSTAHEGAIGIRIGGKYHDTVGTPVADVQAGTKSVNFGCDSWGSLSAYAPFNAGFSAQQAGTEMWLYGCRAWGTTNDLYCITGATMHVLDTTEYDTQGGTGSFVLVA